MPDLRMLGWTVYIVEGARGALYTGITTSVARRYAEHSGRRGRGARFFRTQPPRDLVYVEVAADRSGALRREAEIKRLARSRKLALIAAQREASP
jgi:putative endonuclease